MAELTALGEYRVVGGNAKIIAPFMWQSFIYGMHWKHDGKMYYDEVAAESKEDAVEYFIDNKRDDVTLVRVEYLGPNEGGVQETVGPPVLPFSPLQARRRLGADEDVR